MSGPGSGTAKTIKKWQRSECISWLICHYSPFIVTPAFPKLLNLANLLTKVILVMRPRAKSICC